MISKSTKGLLVGMLALGLLVSPAASPAFAQSSSASLQAQIQALLAQVAALQAQLGVSAGASFTRDLTIGSTGADVTRLQQFLIARGHSIPAGATGYFGAQTRAAVAAFQAANGIAPAAGYFGPLTRAKVNGMIVVTPGTPGTPSTPNDDDDELEGGAGSVDSYELLGSLNSEEVGEDDEDVEVAGLEIEVDDGSDIELTAVRLVFDEGTADEDFEDYASEVSLWLDGEEVGRVDAEDFNDDNDWTATVSLDDGAIIRRGDIGELTVGISAQGNIDSADIGDTWTVDFRQIRFMDADGATVSEDPSTAARTFSFESFATAADVELTIREDDDEINDARTLEVDATNDMDDVEVLSFTMEAEGDSDITIDSLPITVTSTEGTGNDPDDLISALHLIVDGEEIASETLSTADADNSSEVVVFDDLEWTIEEGETAEVMVTADLYSIADTLDAGDTISFAFGETETNLATFDAEDESGENLGNADVTGSASSGAFDLRAAGIMVTFVSASETVTANDNAADNDVGTFRITFNVQAFGSDVYLARSADATTASTITASTGSAGHLYLVEDSGTATTDDLTDIVTEIGDASEASSNNFLLEEDEETELTITVVQTNDSAEDDGLYRVLLKAVAWATTDTTTWNLYDFDLEDFKTDPVNLN
ncbi:MAG TPA: peptidoglycan-binding protein [Candidatus Paceibacterota bacterium]|nr:peptidoglycan-binding protein [Candidatus Paceibacterota bacterium]